MYTEAIHELQKAMTLWGASSVELASLEQAYQQSGPEGYWKWKIAEAKRRSAPYDIAIAYAHVGDAGQAMKWLEKSYQQHDWQMVQLRSFRVWEPIRSDPRFQALLRKMNFPR